MEDAGPDEPVIDAQLRSQAVQKALKETLGADDAKLTQLVLAAVPKWDPYEA